MKYDCVITCAGRSTEQWAAMGTGTLLWGNTRDKVVEESDASKTHIWIHSITPNDMEVAVSNALIIRAQTCSAISL